MSLASSIARFQRQVYRAQRSQNPVTVTEPSHKTGRDVLIPIPAVKSATTDQRTPSDQGAGYILEAVATILIAPDLGFLPVVGTDFTITESPVASEIGTVWRVRERREGSLLTQTPHRCSCYRLD